MIAVSKLANNIFFMYFLYLLYILVVLQDKTPKDKDNVWWLLLLFEYGLISSFS